MLDLAPVMRRPRFLRFALSLLGLAGAFTYGVMWGQASRDNGGRLILVVPYEEYTKQLTPEARQDLEDAFGGDIDKLLAVGLVRPGDMVDLSHPAANFTFQFNRWVRLQAAAKGTLNVKAREQWEEVDDAWEKLRRLVRQSYER